jgi:hypothetical protein
MNDIPVKVTVEPSSCNGVGLWVRSNDQVWWKWYGSPLDAWTEAEQLGLAESAAYPNGTRITLDIRHTAKENAVVNPEELTRFGFKEPPESN